MRNFPIIDPVLLSLGPLKIHWYALAYLFTIIVTYLFLKNQNQKKHIISDEKIDELSIYLILSVILGGRLGYILFYNFSFFLHNPQKIFMINEGGMSWHGAFFGIIITIWLFCRAYKIKFFNIADIIVRTIPIGFFLGRITNFLNQELIGRPAPPNFPLAVIFHKDPLQIPRHPSALYEAFGEGLLLFLMINFMAYFFPKKTGLNSMIFLFGYPIIRIICECFRQPDPQIGFFFEAFTLGQILSFSMILGGIVFLLMKASKYQFIIKF